MQKMFNNLDEVEKLAGGLSNRKVLVYSGTLSQKRTDYQVWGWQDVAITF